MSGCDVVADRARDAGGETALRLAVCEVGEVGGGEETEMEEVGRSYKSSGSTMDLRNDVDDLYDGLWTRMGGGGIRERGASKR